MHLLTVSMMSSMIVIRCAHQTSWRYRALRDRAGVLASFFGLDGSGRRGLQICVSHCAPVYRTSSRAIGFRKGCACRVSAMSRAGDEGLERYAGAGGGGMSTGPVAVSGGILGPRPPNSAGYAEAGFSEECSECSECRGDGGSKSGTSVEVEDDESTFLKGRRRMRAQRTRPTARRVRSEPPGVSCKRRRKAYRRQSRERR